MASINYKNRLQERMQSCHLPLPEYGCIKREGPPHAPRFGVEVKVTWKGDRLVESGEGRKKKDAEQDAARKMLERISPFRGTSAEPRSPPGGPVYEPRSPPRGPVHQATRAGYSPRGGDMNTSQHLLPDPFLEPPVSPTSFKSRLQEWLMANGCPLPKYEEISSTGAANRRTFTRKCITRNIYDIVIAEEVGVASTIKEAEGKAAQKILEKLEREGEDLIFREDPPLHKLPYPPPDIIDTDLDTTYEVLLAPYSPRFLFRGGEGGQHLCLVSAMTGCDYYPITSQGMGDSESVARRAAICNLVANLSDLGHELFTH